MMRPMPTVAGIDSSTQSCKVVVCDADSGAVLAEARAAHPDGTEADPGCGGRPWRRRAADCSTMWPRWPWPGSSTAWSHWTATAG
jgi:hypothetical protein